MPIYDYKCNECNETFEVFVRTLKEESKCPHCEGADLSKLVSLGGFVLKGGGWYADGYSKVKEGE